MLVFSSFGRINSTFCSFLRCDAFFFGIFLRFLEIGGEEGDLEISESNLTSLTLGDKIDEDSLRNEVISEDSSGCICDSEFPRLPFVGVCNKLDFLLDNSLLLAVSSVDKPRGLTLNFFSLRGEILLVFVGER
ncbi:hypothetical protein TVAGG3_0775680, partial [Trichomonas vaginalis G3]